MNPLFKHPLPDVHFFGSAIKTDQERPRDFPEVKLLAEMDDDDTEEPTEFDPEVAELLGFNPMDEEEEEEEC